jgi:hypothetical protein
VDRRPDFVELALIAALIAATATFVFAGFLMLL